jgi:hypothetical protein
MSSAADFAAEEYVFRDSNPVVIQQAAIFDKLHEVRAQGLPKKEEALLCLPLEKELELTRKVLQAQVDSVTKSIQYKNEHPLTVLQEGHGLRKRRDVYVGKERRNTKFLRWWMDLKKRGDEEMNTVSS